MESKKCNLCGKEFDIFDRQEDFRIGRSDTKVIGYGSIHDGECCDCRLCVKCFDRVMKTFRFTIDPFFVPGFERGGDVSEESV